MKRAPLLLCGILFATVTVFGDVTRRIIGTVTDKTGSVIPGATVVALNVETGVTNSTQTNAQGVYSFPALPVGHYSVQIQANGFSLFEETGVVLDVNSARRVDATLQVGMITDKITVLSDTAQVDTQSTQMGELIGGKEMVSLPLDGRNYTELMALQPGVIPYSTSTTGSYSSGISDGTLSVSGGRPNANGFMVNGGNVQEAMQNGASVIPNLDSIAEFRILTNNFDAEYGHYINDATFGVIQGAGNPRIGQAAVKFMF